MTGVGNMMLGNAGVLTAAIVEGAINESVANGTNIFVVTRTSVVFGGTPPYSYQWTDNMFGVTFGTDTASSTTVLATGTDEQHSGTVTLTVTDAAGATSAPTRSALITQGSPP